jgi:hypothetical protein
VVTLRPLLVLLILVACCRPASAGQDPPSGAAMPFQRGAIEISVLGGTSLPVSALHAKPDHSLTLVSFHIGRVMSGGAAGNNFELLVDASPFVHVDQGFGVNGWSLSPLFLRWNFPPLGSQGPRIFSEGLAGMLFTSRPESAEGPTFRFIEQAGFGVRIEQTPGLAWLVGYRFQHISNAGLARPNRGGNFNLVYFGASFLP